MCEKYNIPTAKFGIFNSINDASKFLDNCKFPIVVKADGLAAEKGLHMWKLNRVRKCCEWNFDGKFGIAENVLIEEFLKGEEMSYFIISDGKNFKKFGTAQDHKRVLEGDKGKNTGGMGAYSPSRLISDELEEKILNKIIKPTLKGINDLGSNYKGFLYAGLMIVNSEPYLIEYNVRMGDPECQTILPKLKSDFLSLINNCVEGKLDQINLGWHNFKSMYCFMFKRLSMSTKRYEINLDKIQLEKKSSFFMQVQRLLKMKLSLMVEEFWTL